MILVTHLINYVFFLFARNYFPYTAFQHSDLYMKQQVGVWMFFAMLSGCTVGFMGNKGILYKILAVLSTLFYALIFGAVRYVFFLYIFERFSIFYMSLLFLHLPPSSISSIWWVFTRCMSIKWGSFTTLIKEGRKMGVVVTILKGYMVVVFLIMIVYTSRHFVFSHKRFLGR